MNEKGVLTITIGALSSFEEYFGQLWGNGLSYSKLTPEQKRWRSHWEAARKEILDRGNNLIRKDQR